jgi:protein PET117
MHKGVERDIERDAEKQRARQERQADFDMQNALEQEYRKTQNVPGNADERGGGEKSLG